MKLILASASPRRRELIKSLNLEVVIHPSNVDENVCMNTNEEYAMSLARRKAKSVFEIEKELTLGADTIVCIGNEILGKPKNAEDAEQMFRKLCGKTHEVITGVCFVYEGGEIVDFEKTLVTFNEFNKKIVDEYIKSGAPFDKAGGYGIQDRALSPLIKCVFGDLDNVIGLPVKKIGKILKEKFG